MSRFKGSVPLSGLGSQPLAAPVNKAPVAVPYPSAPMPRVAHRVETPDGLDRVAFFLLLLFLVGFFSRGFDLLPPIHAAMILALACLTLVLFTGKFLRGLQGVTGVCLVLYTAWLFLSIPGSVWRGQSVSILLDSWVKSLLLYLLVSALSTGVGRVITILRTVGIAIFLGGLFVLQQGEMVLGRLTVKEGGTFGNPNDIAALLSIGIVLLWFLAQRNSILVPLLCYAGIAMMTVICFKTGSRGTLLSLGLSAPILLTNYGFLGRIRIAACMALLFVVGVALAPEDTLARLLTTFGIESDARVEEAVASTNSRMELARRAVVITARNPIFGVGMGNFMVADERFAKEENVAAMWHETHNTYLQIASEAGIPALIFYLGILFSCWRSLLRAKRITSHGQWHPRQKELRAAVIALQALITIALFTGLFGSSAYSPVLPTTAALVVSLTAVITEQYRPNGFPLPSWGTPTRMA